MSLATPSTAPARRILMITTSHGRMGEAGKPTGIWAEELATPFFLLSDAGAEVVLASPAGGAVPLDPGSLQPAGHNEPSVERLLRDDGVQARLRATRKASEVDAAAFDAVFLPGGHGTMWDLPTDAGVTRAIESAFAAGRLIASVCHGAAGLVTARRTDGRPVVAGYRINAFTDAEEAAVGLAGVVPFPLETRLRELGALFEGGPPWQAFVLRDGPFLTGQNPQSSTGVAKGLLEALGLGRRTGQAVPAGA